MILPAIGSPGEMVGASRRCSEDPFLSVPAPTLIDEGLLKLNPAPALPAFDPPTAGVSFDGREGDEVVCDEVVCDEVVCDEVFWDEVDCDEVVAVLARERYGRSLQDLIASVIGHAHHNGVNANFSYFGSRAARDERRLVCREIYACPIDLIINRCQSFNDRESNQYRYYPRSQGGPHHRDGDQVLDSDTILKFHTEERALRKAQPIHAPAMENSGALGFVTVAFSSKSRNN